MGTQITSKPGTFSNEPAVSYAQDVPNAYFFGFQVDLTCFVWETTRRLCKFFQVRLVGNSEKTTLNLRGNRRF
jgi:hypothetical protein